MRLITEKTRKKYPGQSHPQPKRLTITREGDVVLDYKPNIGAGTSPERWHRVTPTIEFFHGTITREIVAYYAKNKDLFECVWAGHEVAWDGNNHVGRFDEDAREAWETLIELADKLEGGEYS